MYILRFIARHIRRTFSRSIMTVLLAVTLILLMNMFSNARNSELLELERVYDEFDIRVTVSNISGSNTENLKITQEYISSFTSASSSLSEYLEDVNLKRSLEYAFVDDIDVTLTNVAASLIGITDAPAAPLLSPENGASISFLAGYDSTHFRFSEKVCLVSTELLGLLDKSPGENVEILLTATDAKGETRETVVSMKIVGSISGSATYNIYCPWEVIVPLSRELGMYEHFSESMSATISDNRKIDEFKQKAKTMYTQTSVVDMDTKYKFAITVNDEVFNTTARELKQSAELNEALSMIISGLSAVLGFVVCYLSVRHRKQELAVMRSIGISRSKVFLTVCMEQLVLCLVGIIIGIVSSLIVWKTATVLGVGAIFVCFALGVVLSTISQTNVNVMETIKKKE